MQAAMWSRGHFLPGAAGAGVVGVEHSSSARRGGWESSSTVSFSTHCVESNTVDCRDRRSGLIRLNRSESAGVVLGGRRVEARFHVSGCTPLAAWAGASLKHPLQVRMPDASERLTGAHFVCLAARPIVDSEIQGIGSSTRPAWAGALARDQPQWRIPRLTCTLLENPQKPLKAAPLLARGRLNAFVTMEDTNGKA